MGLHRAIRASGNPMTVGEIDTSNVGIMQEKDQKRAIKLGENPVGSAHDHFLLGIHVQFDIKYPQYWTIEAERYHWFNIISSQSKMHKLCAMGKDDEFNGMFNKYVNVEIIDVIRTYIDCYNMAKEENNQEGMYYFFMKALSNLPMGFELWMTCDLTYLQLKTMYFQRKNHKLKEDWNAFCLWVLTLPLFSELIGVNKEKEEDELREKLHS